MLRPRPRRTVRTLLLAALVLGAAGAAAQQGFGRWRGRPLHDGLPLRAGIVQREFTFCRLMYESVRREANGQGWSTDYPDGDHNFSMRFEELTRARVSRWENGEPGYAVVAATDSLLYQCPFLFASDVGTMGLGMNEVHALRDYLNKGGFLWVDDFWGDYAWQQWVYEIRRVLPGREIVELTPEHPLFTALYAVRRVPQVPSIQFWRRSGGATSERGTESAVPAMYAMFDDYGNIMVLMSHNTDVADGWEREGEDTEFFASFSPESYALGINIAIFALTH